MSLEATSADEMYKLMLPLLDKIVPAPEIRMKAELAFEINRLKKEQNTIILGHNYMEAALFISVPDIVGDSLELSRRAAETNAECIIFCGVRFMAETAKILNPSVRVLLPADKAGCSLAASITADDVLRLKAQFPGVPVVTYINTYAEVKAVSDICCTSGNAQAVVNSFDSDQIIFLPDEYLAKNIARDTGKTILVPGKDGTLASSNLHVDMIGWNGRCEVHERFTVEDIRSVREQFPDVEILAHPECSPEVVEASDYSGSTTAMINQVKKSKAGHFLILTECAMADNIIAENPDKDILRLCSVRCPHMNEITLEGVLRSLREGVQEIDVPEPIRSQARIAVERMLAITNPPLPTAMQG